VSNITSASRFTGIVVRRNSAGAWGRQRSQLPAGPPESRQVTTGKYWVGLGYVIDSSIYHAAYFFILSELWSWSHAIDEVLNSLNEGKPITRGHNGYS